MTFTAACYRLDGKFFNKYIKIVENVKHKIWRTIIKKKNNDAYQFYFSLRLIKYKVSPYAPT